MDELRSRMVQFPPHEAEIDPPVPLMNDELLGRRCREAEQHAPGSPYHRLLTAEAGRREAEWERIAPGVPGDGEWLAPIVEAHRDRHG